MVRSADDVDGGRVPSDVYQKTQAGLGAIVSQRVAGGVLSRVLEQRGVDPESVDGPQMRELLLGPVLRDLQSVLPESGLRRHLERLANSLQGDAQLPEIGTHDAGTDVSGTHDVEAPDAGSRDAVTHDAGSGYAGSRDADPYDFETPNIETNDVEMPDEDRHGAPAVESPGVPSFEPAATANPAAPDETTDSADSSAVSDSDRTAAPRPLEGPAEAALQAEVGPELHTTPEGQTTDPTGTPDEASPFETVEPSDAPPPPIASRPATSPEVWESHISTLARLDNIRTIAVIRDGNPLVGRGDGIDVNLLARLSRVAFRLLEKASPVRSIQLRHSDGVLLAWELGGDLLVLHGTTSLNIGAVTTTFASLLQEESV